MGVAGYARTRVWEAALLAVAASALVYTLFSAFYASQPLQQAPWAVALVCTAVVAALYACAYSMRATLVGGIALGAVAVGVLVAAAVGNPGATPVDDVEGNFVIPALVLLFVCLAGFFAVRTKVGAVAFLVVGVLLCAVVEYLYFYGHVASALLFALSAAGLVAVRGYARSLRTSAASRLVFMPLTLAALALGVLALAGSFAVWHFVIEPLDPPKREVKLVVEHRRVEEVEIRGTGTATGEDAGDQGNLSDGDEQESSTEAQDDFFDTMQAALGAMLGMSDDQTGDEGTTTSLSPLQVLGIILLVLVAALVAGVIALRRALRRRRFARMTEGDADSSMRALYLFFLDRFARMKVPHPQNLSPLEYAREFASTFQAFEQPDGRAGAEVADGEPAAGFDQLTRVYARSVYGGLPATEDELSAFTGYYDALYPRSRRYLGRLRYALRYFRL